MSDEYPVEGADAGNVLPDDLWNPDGTNPSAGARSENAPVETREATESEDKGIPTETAQPEPTRADEPEVQGTSEESASKDELPPRAETPAP